MTDKQSKYFYFPPMTDDDKNALKEFMNGVAFTFGLVGITVVAIVMLSGGDVPDDEQSTKVVGTYKGCDIIQWNYSALAEYKYFLHCNNTRPVYEQ